ncbi:MAG: element excision factor XisH family protein [Blastocatellia bacterium]
MAARDKVHQQVVNALKKDGWTITHDPFKVRWKRRGLQIDPGAERLLAAQKDATRIAVEIKSFVGANDLEDLYQAIGQFILYRQALRKSDPDRTLFLALTDEIYRQLFADDEGEALRAEEEIRLLVFNRQTEEIVLWKQ